MNDFTLDNVNEMYIDVLREIGNIGAGNATTSLASMINEQIDMNVPKVELMEASKLSSAICPEDEIIVGIFLEVTHDITGSMMFLMRMDSAHYLVNKLMGRDPENDAPFDEMDLSAMKEIGNIITASYLSALSSMTTACSGNISRWGSSVRNFCRSKMCPRRRCRCNRQRVPEGRQAPFP